DDPISSWHTPSGWTDETTARAADQTLDSDPNIVAMSGGNANDPSFPSSGFNLSQYYLQIASYVYMGANAQMDFTKNLASDPKTAGGWYVWSIGSNKSKPCADQRGNAVYRS